MSEQPENLRLRRSRAEDASAIKAIRAHPLVRQFQPIEDRTLDELEHMLEERGSVPLTSNQSGKVQWTIVSDQTVAGWVSVSVISRTHHTGAIGYSVDPRFQGRGFATVALTEVVNITFAPDALGLERLEAVAAVENVASRRVLGKCGFRLEGIAAGYLIISGRRVDHARYGLLRTSNGKRKHV